MVQKCDFCKIKKVNSVLAFNCKCGLKYLCSTCRYPDDHKCDFDFLQQNKITLEKNNPKIIGEKFIKL